MERQRWAAGYMLLAMVLLSLIKNEEVKGTAFVLLDIILKIPFIYRKL